MYEWCLQTLCEARTSVFKPWVYNVLNEQACVLKYVCEVGTAEYEIGTRPGFPMCLLNGQRLCVEAINHF